MEARVREHGSIGRTKTPLETLERSLGLIRTEHLLEGPATGAHTPKELTQGGCNMPTRWRRRIKAQHFVAASKNAGHLVPETPAKGAIPGIGNTFGIEPAHSPMEEGIYVLRAVAMIRIFSSQRVAPEKKDLGGIRKDPRAGSGAGVALQILHEKPVS